MNFKIGDKVTFKPGPKSTSEITAKVVGNEGAYLVTKDDAGKERKVRPGAARAA